MTHLEKLEWMRDWAKKNKANLELEGSCGFGRECVGITVDDTYPSYEWYSDYHMNRLDQNGDVWTPEDAYHKHPCIAVLGRGENAESQLYEWLKWFDDNNFTLISGAVDNVTNLELLDFLRGHGTYKRMVKMENR